MGTLDNAIVHIYDHSTRVTTNLELASYGHLILDGNLAVFGVFEDHQGFTDLNNDGDADDGVLHVVEFIPQTFCNDVTIDELISSGNYNIIDNRDSSLGHTIIGTENNDLILGSDNGDQLEGKAGDDCIIAGNGNDTIFAGMNNDIIFGQAGNDKIEGDLGDDTIFAGKGNDELLGEDGNDSLDGGPGNDSCDGGIGVNTHVNCEDIPKTFCNDMTIDELISSGNYNVIDNRDGSLGDTISGTNGHDLILTSDFGNRVDGFSGDDCIIG
ncbi:MAG: hypothetical protein OEL81_08535, partial [Nitrosopumilus sp.]|nr:hypothetical protein [Nitrosopumilus sp.]